MKNTIVILLSLIVVAAGIGCAAMSYYITPAKLDSRAVNYAVSAQVAEPNDFAGWPNLEKAIRLKASVDAAHQVNGLAYAQMIEKDSLNYSQLSQIVARDVEISQQREELLFGETGILALGLSMAGAGGLAGYIGMMRKRPQDWAPEEVEKLKSDIGFELSEKDHRFIELVRLIQEFRNADQETDGAGNAKLVKILDKMSPQTKLAVKEVKIENQIM